MRQSSLHWLSVIMQLFYGLILIARLTTLASTMWKGNKRKIHESPHKEKDHMRKPEGQLRDCGSHSVTHVFGGWIVGAKGHLSQVLNIYRYRQTHKHTHTRTAVSGSIYLFSSFTVQREHLDSLAAVSNSRATKGTLCPVGCFL